MEKQGINQKESEGLLMTFNKKIFVQPTSLLSFIFFFSGFAALIYQVAWQRLLTLHYGVGTVSITLIVSVYMVGLGLGALLGGYFAERSRNKLFFYFIVELLIGCFGLISLPFLDFLGRFTSGSSYLLSFLYMFLFLCIPTLLMGITLPLLTKIFNALIKNFLDTVSFLYFINTIGAAIGAVFASYVVISFWGLDNAVYCAAGINFTLAVLILFAKHIRCDQGDNVEYPVDRLEQKEAIFGKLAYLLVFITGFLAISYEIVWFRVVGILVKASPYAFSSVLFVYLSGIAIGSFGMSRYLRKHSITDKKSLFFSIQFLIGISVITIFIGYYYLTRHTVFGALTRNSFAIELHPTFQLSLSSIKVLARDIYSLTDVFLWPLFFVFVPTIFMGASFPLISLLALSHSNREGKTVGTIYFYNIAGNVLGGILTGFVFLPYLGTETTITGFSLVGLFFGLFISSAGSKQLKAVPKAGFIVFLIIISAMLLPKRGQLYKAMHTSPGNGFESYFEEGVDGMTMIFKHNEKVWLYINGLIHGIRPVYIFSYETLEAVSYAEKVKDVLIIGYGAGSITEAVLKMDNLGKVTLVELNDSLIRNMKKITTFKNMLTDNRLELIIDDGRRFLLRTDKKYDLILIDPLRSTESYSNNLYSRQFFVLVNQHLNEGGIFMAWMDEYRVIPKTILSAFNHVRVYNFFCLASNKPFVRNDEQRKRFFDNLSPQAQSAILTLIDRESKNVGDRDHIEKLVSGYPINQDWKPVTEYYLGLKIKENKQINE
jgi:predicted membrane-bound spermidine synthase